MSTKKVHQKGNRLVARGIEKAERIMIMAQYKQKAIEIYNERLKGLNLCRAHKKDGYRCAKNPILPLSKPNYCREHFEELIYRE